MRHLLSAEFNRHQLIILIIAIAMPKAAAQVAPSIEAEVACGRPGFSCSDFEQLWGELNLSPGRVSELIAESSVLSSLATTTLASVQRPLLQLLEDRNTGIFSLSQNDALCILNRNAPEALSDLRASLPDLQAHNGCSGIGGVVVIGYPGMPGSDRPGSPSDPVAKKDPPETPIPPDTSLNSTFWARLGQQELDLYMAAFREAQVTKWRLENEARDAANNLTVELAAAQVRFADYWSSDDVLDHNSAALKHQRFASGVVFYIVLFLVGLGVCLTVAQFVIAMRTSRQIRPELPEVKNAFKAVAVGTAGPAAVQLAETEFKFEMGKIGMAVRTSIIGMVVLIASFGFLFLYLRYAFPLSFPSVPAVEAISTESTESTE